MILGNKSDFCLAVILENENGSCVDVILVNGNNLDVDVSRINWVPLHTDFSHYRLSFLGYFGLVSGAYLLPPIPNLSQVCATALLPNLFPQIVHALRHLISFGVFDMTPL